MKRHKDFEEQQREISEQVQIVLEARLELKNANDAYQDARTFETDASNRKNDAQKKLSTEQTKLDELLKKAPTT